MMKKVTALLVMLLAAFALSIASSTRVAAQETDDAEATGTIMDVLKQDDRLDTFVVAVQAAVLADNLDDDGPFTVFAPTDEAFAAFEAMAAEEDPEATLTDILLYHVVNGNYSAPEVAELDFLPTLAGERLRFNVEAGTIVVNDRAEVISMDVEASNGVIHIIDAVLIPPVNALATSEQGDFSLTIWEILENSARFETLVNALEATGLAAQLDNPNEDLTLFAPTDEAFDELSEDRLNDLVSEPEGELDHVLRYHLIGDSLSINQIANDDLIPTVEGRPLFVSTDESLNIYLNGVPITDFNIRASNGVIHVVEEVVFP